MLYAPDNFAIVILMEDAPIHTDVHPFCSDPTCPCHEDEDNIAMVAGAILDGALTPDEATRFVAGRQV